MRYKKTMFFFALALPLTSIAASGMPAATKAEMYQSAQADAGGMKAVSEADLRNSASETLSNLGISVSPGLTSQSQATGDLSNAASLSFTQKREFDITVGNGKTDLKAGQMYEKMGVAFYVESTQPIMIQICDVSMMGGFCKPQDAASGTGDWSAPIAVSSTITKRQGSPLIQAWDIVGECSGASCTVHLTSTYTQGGTPTSPPSTSEPNLLGQQRASENPIAQMMTDIRTKPLPDGTSYSALRGKTGANPTSGTLQAVSDCSDSRLSNLKTTGKVTIDCNDPSKGSFDFDIGSEFDLSGVTKAPSITVPAADGDEAFGKAVAIANQTEQVARYGVADADGNISMFTGKVATCKNVNTGFQNWVTASGYGGAITAMFTSAPDLQCCRTDPDKINTGANFGFCTDEEKELAMAKLADRVHYIQGADTESNRSVCINPSIGNPALGFLINPMIAPDVRDYPITSDAQEASYYLNRFYDARVCGTNEQGGSSIPKAYAAYMMGLSTGNDSAFLSTATGVIGAALSHKLTMFTQEYYCQFPSVLARLIQEQGRPQINAMAASSAAGAKTKTMAFPFYGSNRSVHRDTHNIPGDYTTKDNGSTVVGAGPVDQGTDVIDEPGVSELVAVDDESLGTRAVFTDILAIMGQIMGTAKSMTTMKDPDVTAENFQLTATFGLAGYLPSSGKLYYSAARSPLVISVCRYKNGVCDTKTLTKITNPANPCSVNGLVIQEALYCAVWDDGYAVYLKQDFDDAILSNGIQTSCPSGTYCEISIPSSIKSYLVKAVVSPPTQTEIPGQPEYNPGVSIPNPPTVEPNGTVTVPGGDFNVSEQAGWLPLDVVNDSVLTFWQWNGQCETVANGGQAANQDVATQARGHSIQSSADCPVSDDVYMAVCETADCGDLPINPILAADSKWVIYRLHADDESNAMTAITRYVLVQGNCANDKRLCNYKISALPRGIGGQLHANIDLAWDLKSYTAPSGGSWDTRTLKNYNQFWVQAYTYSSTDDDAVTVPKIRYCKGTAALCKVSNSGVWTEKTLSTAVEAPGVTLYSDPDISVLGGGCNNVTGCKYHIDIQLKITAMPWLNTGAAYPPYQNVEIEYRKEKRVLGKLIISSGSVKLPHDFKSYPSCEGFTLDQFMALDLSQMDFSDYIKSLTGKAEDNFTNGWPQ